MEFVLRREQQDTWRVLVKPGKRAQIGARFVFGNGLLKAEVLERTEKRDACPWKGFRGST